MIIYLHNNGSANFKEQWTFNSELYPDIWVEIWKLKYLNMLNKIKYRENKITKPKQYQNWLFGSY